MMAMPRMMINMTMRRPARVLVSIEREKEKSEIPWRNVAVTDGRKSNSDIIKSVFCLFIEQVFFKAILPRKL